MRLLILCLTLFTSLSVSAFWETKKSERFKTYLKAVVGRNASLFYKCEKYMGREGCRRLTKIFSKSLDAELIYFKTPEGDETESVVIFKQRLLELAESSETTQFLHSVKLGFNFFANHVNLWDEALKAFETKEKATIALGVLFQDTSQMRSQVQYLKSQGDRYQELTTLLNETIDMFQAKSNQLTKEQYYPPHQNPEEVAQGKIYHFYVPAATTAIMMQNGAKRRGAAFLPFLLTYNYELFSEQHSLWEIIFEPKRLEANESLTDLYACYSGVLFTAGYWGLTWEQFSDKFERYPRRTLQILATTFE